uniref:Uncharacterized protein n=1 Tax=Arcella intermedia TaxID=1963864 RepID=A0A6B2L1D5_9EUKA
MLFFGLVAVGFYIYTTYVMKNLFDGYNSPLASQKLRLTPGWIPGRYMDDRDTQYHSFREFIPLLIIASFVMVGVGRLITFLWRSPRLKLTWNFIFGFLFVAVTSEGQILFPLFILTTNYYIVRFLGKSRLSPVFTWTYNCGLLVYFEYYHRFANIHPSLAFLDQYYGMFPWNSVPYAMTLRVISYGLDYYWMLTNPSKEVPNYAVHVPYETRQNTSASPGDYTLVGLLSFAFFFPTWVAGPYTTYNSYISHINNPQTSYPPAKLFLYFFRLLCCMLLKEVMDHYFYLTSYNTYIFSSGLWREIPVSVLAILSYWTLKSMYLKFLIIWRLFRTVALFDGIEIPENMDRCMSNNYTVSGFWRSWHRSFNMWLLRYVYFPLGGSRGNAWLKVRNIFLVFTFVVFAHAPRLVTDPQILAWGYSMAVFMLPELLAAYVFRSNGPLGGLRGKWYWKHIVSAGGSVMIVILIIGNICGYGLTLSSRDKTVPEVVLELVEHVFSWKNWLTVFSIFSLMMVGTEIMLVIRNVEEIVEGRKRKN